MPLARAVNALVERCVAAKRDGADFPTVWNTILRHNRLVAGQPVQAMEAGEPFLTVLLITNQRLVHRGDLFSVQER